MTPQMSDLFKIWIFRLSLGIALIVALLSWVNGLRFFDVAVRSGVSFGVIFLLLSSILMVFQKTALPVPESEPSGKVSGRGGIIDFSVGDEVPTSKTDEELFPGQVDPNLSLGLTDHKRKADIVRRMGWGDDGE